MKIAKKLFTITASLGIITSIITGGATPSLAYPTDPDTGEAIPNVCYQYVHIENIQNFSPLVLASKRAGASYVWRLHRIYEQSENSKIIELAKSEPSDENKSVGLVYSMGNTQYGGLEEYSKKEYVIQACTNGKHITLETAGTPDGPILVKKEQIPPKR